MKLPLTGNVFLSVRNEDKAEALSIARSLQDMGFKLFATSGTSKFLNTHYLTVETIARAGEAIPSCVDLIRAGKFSLVINTASDLKAIRDSFTMRRAALEQKIPYANIISSARAMIQAIREEKKGPLEILPL